MIGERMTKTVRVGNVQIGGSAPVSVQTMYDIPLCKQEENLASRMNILKAMGCDIMRVSYPQIKEHDDLIRFTSNCCMPVVADIHFDYKNAMDAMDCNIAALRINPGNIGAKWKTEEIVKKALDKNLAIRIGLNSGSLPKNEKKQDMPTLMTETALEYISWFENLGFYNTVVSLKASDENYAYEAYKKFASFSDYPLHLGVTEAGGAVSSCVKTTWTLGRLLSENIGSTIRYSITGSIEDEVLAGNELLRTLGLRKGGVRIVSCPMCGRKSFDSQKFYKEAQSTILSCNKDITVAIMGCQVNGPGEAKGANVAITGIGNKVYIYKDGEIFKEVKSEEALMSLSEVLREYK